MTRFQEEIVTSINLKGRTRATGTSHGAQSRILTTHLILDSEFFAKPGVLLFTAVQHSTQV